MRRPAAPADVANISRVARDLCQNLFEQTVAWTWCCHKNSIVHCCMRTPVARGSAICALKQEKRIYILRARDERHAADRRTQALRMLVRMVRRVKPLSASPLDVPTHTHTHTHRSLQSTGPVFVRADAQEHKRVIDRMLGEIAIRIASVWWYSQTSQTP